MKSHLIWLLLTISLFLAGTQIQKETNAHVRTASKAPHQTFPSSQSNRSPKSNSSPSLSKRTQQVRNESRAGIPNDQSPHADGIPFTNPWASRFPSINPSINPSTTPSNSRPSDISPATPGTSTQIPENTPGSPRNRSKPSSRPPPKSPIPSLVASPLTSFSPPSTNSPPRLHF